MKYNDRKFPYFLFFSFCAFWRNFTPATKKALRTQVLEYIMEVGLGVCVLEYIMENRIENWFGKCVQSILCCCVLLQLVLATSIHQIEGSSSRVSQFLFFWSLLCKK